MSIRCKCLGTHQTGVIDYDSISTFEVENSLMYTMTGNGLTMMSNRLSWFYDLKGTPSPSLRLLC